jgi:hypothetical protein
VRAAVNGRLADAGNSCFPVIIYAGQDIRGAGFFHNKSRLLTGRVDPGMFINQGRNVLARRLENDKD